MVNDFVGVTDAIASDNGWPNFECRAAFGLRRHDEGTRQPIEIGISGLVGEVRAVGALANISTTWAAMIDFRVEGEIVGLRGELWTGDALGTYGGGIGQSLNLVSGQAIHSSGGWLESYCKLTSYVTTHLGVGIDDPLDTDLSAGQRLHNRAIWANVLWDMTEQWQFGFEVSQWQTDNLAPSGDNEAIIFQYRTQFSY